MSFYGKSKETLLTSHISGGISDNIEESNGQTTNQWNHINSKQISIWVSTNDFQTKLKTDLIIHRQTKKFDDIAQIKRFCLQCRYTSHITWQPVKLAPNRTWKWLDNLLIDVIAKLQKQPGSDVILYWSIINLKHNQARTRNAYTFDQRIELNNWFEFIKGTPQIWKLTSRSQKTTKKYQNNKQTADIEFWYFVSYTHTLIKRLIKTKKNPNY